MSNADKILACSKCFTDQGLQLVAEDIGETDSSACPNCGSIAGKKLTERKLEYLAHSFFVDGTTQRFEYGQAPLVIFNDKQTTSVEFSPWLTKDVNLFERLLGIGFFDYGPRFWMFGEVEPLKKLIARRTRAKMVRRIIKEYPTLVLDEDEQFFRVRKDVKSPGNQAEFDSPPAAVKAVGRFNALTFPVFYASPDLQTCVHECRTAVEDSLFVATVCPNRPLKLLNLASLLEEKNVDEFESLDMAMHMLLLAGKHSYEITQDIAVAAKNAGFDGLVYTSYFSSIRTGVGLFTTSYGISHRRIPRLQGIEQSLVVPNLVLFGYPIKEKIVSVKCMNKLMLGSVQYDLRFGPVTH